MKIGNRSLASRFTFIVIVILLIGQSTLWFWFLLGQRKHHITMHRTMVKSTAELLIDLSLYAVKTDDFDTLNRNLKVAVKDKDIMSVKFLNDKGIVVVEQGEITEKSTTSLNPFYIPWHNIASFPVMDGNRGLGTLEIHFSGRSANREILHLLTIPPMGQALVFLFITLAIYYFFQKKAGNYIDILNRKISQITKGDLTVDIPIKSDDEIGRIASGLRFLVEGLSTTVSKLHETGDNVDMAIKQLNMTFRSVSVGMRKQSESMHDMLDSLKDANESQKQITDSTDKLSEFSSENVTSLLEMRSTSDEIVLSANKLSETVESSYSIVSEMSQTAKNVAVNTNEVLSAIEDTSASVEEISASVKSIENTAKDSTRIAENVKQMAAEEGVLTVAEAIDGMEKLSDKVRYSVEVVSRLGARSRDIDKMLSVIRDVTEQTNLLSLNAAILAVQAGEYGKGFSIVSDEIKALSDRTAISTKEIAGIVNTIQKEISDVVVSIEDGMVLVEEGSAKVYLAGEQIAKVVEEAQKSARMTGTIERATEEQARGLSQIRASIESIRTMMTQAAKATEEQSRGSSYMTESLEVVRDATEVSKRGVEEQAAGIKLISKNIELAADKVADINRAAVNQHGTNEGIISSIELIRNTVVSVQTDVDDISRSLKTLQDEVLTLRKGIESFRTK